MEPQTEDAAPAVNALDQPLRGELLEIAVHGDRRDVVRARELADRDASAALNQLEDLRSAKGGGHRQRYWRPSAPGPPETSRSVRAP